MADLAGLLTTLLDGRVRRGLAGQSERWKQGWYRVLRRELKVHRSLFVAFPRFEHRAQRFPNPAEPRGVGHHGSIRQAAGSMEATLSSSSANAAFHLRLLSFSSTEASPVNAITASLVSVG